MGGTGNTEDNPQRRTMRACFLLSFVSWTLDEHFHAVTSCPSMLSYAKSNGPINQGLKHV